VDKFFLNNQDLTQWGLKPGVIEGCNIALSGAWDMPERTGTTHFQWPDDDGVEPYLRADEIFFAGRDLYYSFLLEAETKEAALRKSYVLFDAISGFNGLVLFRSDDFGTFNVYVKDQIKVDYLGHGWCKGVIPFREPEADLSGVIPTPDYIYPGIDNISFAKLGVILSDSVGEFNRPDTLNGAFTAYGHEGYQVTKPAFRQIKLSFLINQPSYEAFNNIIKTMYALFSKPNARTLVLENVTREVFAKDGFKVTGVQRVGAGYFGKLDIELSEIRVLETWNLLTDASGLILTDASGVPLTEILKMS